MAASNVALSRSAPPLPNTRATRATIRGAASAKFKTSLSLPSSSLFYTGPKPLVALSSSVNRCSASAGPTPILATIPPIASIAAGERIPDATLSYVDDDGELRRTTTVAELTAGKKVVLLYVGNALSVDNMFFAYRFVEMAKKLQDLGVDTVACVGRVPSSSSKVQTWQTFLGKESGAVLLADRGEFNKALGWPDSPLRVCIDDGVVKIFGEFYGNLGAKADAVQECKTLKKLLELLKLMISGKTGARSPQPANTKEIATEGTNENGSIDSISGKKHIEKLMEQQVTQEWVNKLSKFEKEFEMIVRNENPEGDSEEKSGLDRSKIESFKKDIMSQLKLVRKGKSVSDRSKIESLKKDLMSQLKLEREGKSDRSKIESLKKDIKSQLKLARERKSVSGRSKIESLKKDLMNELKLVREGKSDRSKIESLKKDIKSQLKLARERKSVLGRSKIESLKKDLMNELKLAREGKSDRSKIESLKKDIMSQLKLARERKSVSDRSKIESLKKKIFKLGDRSA